MLPRDDLVRLGSEYGGWVVPSSMLDGDSVCYCCGVGDDVSFDLALIQRWGCVVHAFDPTPRAAALARTVAADEPRYAFSELGVWSRDDTISLFAPKDRSDAMQVENWSATPTQGPALQIDAKVRSISSLMRERGHTRLDLLKLDVEGAEYEVLGSALDEELDIRIVCVEFHKTPSVDPMIEMVRRLDAAGYGAVALDGFDVTFVRGVRPDHFKPQ